jgi:acetyltransferase/esterase
VSPVHEQFTVAGATLSVESHGSGPLLLFIVGGNGDPAIFSGVADFLASHFYVVTYTRRGFVGSALEGPVNDSTRLDLDVDDAAALLHHFGTGPAFIFGSSSGAIVALDLVLRHPDLIEMAVLHEPPILDLLDDSDAWAEKFAAIYATYEREGLWPALLEFGETVGLGRPMGPPAGATLSPEQAAMLERTQTDMTFWFEHEFRQYPAYLVNTDEVAGVADKLLLTGGQQSRESGTMPILPITHLATRLGREVVEFPGGHVGYLEHPQAFAQQLATILSSEK